MYSSTSVTLIADSFAKVRYITDFFEIIIKPFSSEEKNETFRVTLDNSKKYEAEKLYVFFKFMVLMKKSKSAFGRFDSKKLPNLDFGITVFSFETDYRDILHLFEDVLLLKKEFNLTESLLVSVEEILAASRSITSVASIFKQDMLEYGIAFDEISPRAEFNKKSAAVFMVHTQIGEFVLYIVMVITGFLQKNIDEEKIFIQSTNYRVERKFCLKKEDFDKTAIIELLNEIEDKYESEYQLLVGYDKDK